MKTLTFILVFIASIGIYNSCKPKAEKVDSKKAELEAAEHEFENDYELFEKEWKKNFRENKSMADQLRTAAKQLHGDEKALRIKLSKEFEKKNDELDQKLRKYTYKGMKDWELFKSDFTTEAQTLSQALKEVNKQAVSP